MTEEATFLAVFDRTPQCTWGHPLERLRVFAGRPGCADGTCARGHGGSPILAARYVASRCPGCGHRGRTVEPGKVTGNAVMLCAECRTTWTVTPAWSGRWTVTGEPVTAGRPVHVN